MPEQDPVWINYRELADGSASLENWPTLADNVGSEPQAFEEEIARYLETAPAYSGLGKIVSDVLDPNAKVVLFPGTRTDGLYLWPAVLPYYVRKYHLRVPSELVNRMAAFLWRPPSRTEVDWKKLGFRS